MQTQNWNRQIYHLEAMVNDTNYLIICISFSVLQLFYLKEAMSFIWAHIAITQGFLTQYNQVVTIISWHTRIWYIQLSHYLNQPKFVNLMIIGIALCNIIYKIISKVIASWIKEILPIIIFYSQSTLVPGHQVSDYIRAIQEFIHSLHTQWNIRQHIEIFLYLLILKQSSNELKANEAEAW